MKIDDYIALIKITIRINGGKRIDYFQNENMILTTPDVRNDNFMYECINDYIDYKIVDDIEPEKLENGLHFFIIGFNMESSYDSYHNEYDTDYFGAVLSHNRPRCLNDVRSFLINTIYNDEIYFEDENSKNKKIDKLYKSIDRNSRPKIINFQ